MPMTSLLRSSDGREFTGNSYFVSYLFPAGLGASTPSGSAAEAPVRGGIPFEQGQRRQRGDGEREPGRDRARRRQRERFSQAGERAPSHWP